MFKLFRKLSIFCIVYFGCCVPLFAKTCIKIGIIGEFNAPTMGYSRYFGKETAHGVQLAINDLNKSTQQICFQPIKIETNNHLVDISPLIKNASSQGINFFIGLGTSDTAEAAISGLEKTNSLLISPTASYSNLLKTGRIITFFPSTKDVATEVANFLLKKNINAVTIIYTPNRYYSDKMAQEFKNTFESKGGIIKDIFPTRSGGVDIAPFVDELKRNKDYYIFLPVTDVDAAEIFLEFEKYGLNAYFIGSDSWATYYSYIKKLVDKLVTHAAINATIPIMYDPTSPYEKNQIFVKEYKNKYKKLPTDLEAFSYDAVFVLNKMLSVCSEKDILKSPIKCLNKSLPIPSTTGEINQNHDYSLSRQIFMKNIKFGQNEES